jgi:hypothetical protein
VTTASGNATWAPVAIFAYNRPDKLSALMTSLASCEGFANTPVTIFVDGPKRESDRLKVEQVRHVAEHHAGANVSWSFRETNSGLRKSVYAGVTEVLSKFDRVIVLEDDLVLSPIALSYFNTALRTYESEARVWSIAGYTYDAPALRPTGTTLTLPFAHSWGWATWARAWDQFDLDNRPSPRTLQSSAFRSAFDMGGLYPFTALMKISIEGRVDSWFIHWYYTIFQHGGVSIFPPRRVVENYGLSEGTHGGSLNPHEKMVSRPDLLTTMPGFSSSEDVNFPALDMLKRSRELRVQRFIARAGLAKRRLTGGR